MAESNSSNGYQLTLPYIADGPKPERSSEEILLSWREPGPLGFYNFLEDVQPRILHRDNRYRPFNPTVEQLQSIDDILAVDNKGEFLHSLSLIIAPRRHGKSVLFALLILWLTTSRQNHLTQLLGTTEQHTRRTQYRLLVGIVRNTPALSAMIPESSIHLYEIHFPPLRSLIQMSSGISTQTSFGEKINILWCSDLHAAIDLSSFNALQASLLDSDGSLIWIDSNVGPLGSAEHDLQKEASHDPGMFTSHVSYKDFKEFRKKAPEWIDREKAKRLKRTSLPADFKRDVLGQRSSTVNALFPEDVIKLCKSRYRYPVQDVKALLGDRAYKIGGALDRSKSLIAVGRRDRTVWTVVAKVASLSGEPEIFVLNQLTFPLNLASAIKSQILQDHERYDLDNIVLEMTETSDLFQWAHATKLPCELISPTDSNQNIAFPELARIAREGRLHFPETMKQLAQEMRAFTYQYRKGGTGNKYSFGSANKDKFKDDAVYSLCWAVFALRKAVLSMYQLGNIQCVSKSAKRSLCYLMGGDLVLLCSKQCTPHYQVEQMLKEYKQFTGDDDILIDDFFTTRVKVKGAKLYQAA